MNDPKSERPSGSPAPGDRVSFDLTTGPGCVVLTLADGAVLQVHPIILDVARLQGRNDLGEQIYSVQASFAIRLMQAPTEAAK